MNSKELLNYRSFRTKKFYYFLLLKPTKKRDIN